MSKGEKEHRNFNGVGQTDSSLINGSAGDWYQKVLGTRFECPNCETEFEVTERHVGLWKSTDKPSFIRQKLAQRFKRIRGYNQSDDKIRDGLFTEDGILVQGVIWCPYCLYQNGHHDEKIQDIFSIPSSPHQNLGQEN